MKKRFSTGGWCHKLGLFTAVIVVGGLCSSAMADQSDSTLNQLFRMDRPAKSGQGQGFVGGQVSWYDFDNDVELLDIRGFVEYGVTPELSVNLVVPWRKVDFDGGDESEVIDIRVGAQYNLHQFIDPGLVKASAQVVIGLPVADDDTGLDKGELQIEPSLLLYKSFGTLGTGGEFGVYGQIGANIASAKHNIILGVAPTWEVMKDVILVSEFYLGCGRVTGTASTSDLEWIPGVVCRGLKGFEFAVGVPIGITSDAPNWGLIGKFNWAW